jgi:hypothetical protein
MFKLTGNQLQNLLNYLSARPWGEVNNLIVEFSKLEKIDNKNQEELIKKELKDLSKV